MIDRRKFTVGGLAALGATGMIGTLPGKLNAAEVGDDGLHVQDWFLQTFLEIGEDQQEMDQDGKHLALLFEQKGCPYCKEMHEVNLAKPKIVDFIKENFGVLQINMFGSRTVTDIDGTEMEEKEFARKWRVNFTPTIIYLKTGDLTGKSHSEAEAARMPGYLKPFHFISMFEYVADKRYEKQDFQRYIHEKVKLMEERGEKPDIW